MEVRLSITEPDMSKEELRLLLQAIRDVERKHFKDRDLFVLLDTKPEMDVEETKEFLKTIKPPWASLQKLPKEAPWLKDLS